MFVENHNEVKFIFCHLLKSNKFKDGFCFQQKLRDHFSVLSEFNFLMNNHLCCFGFVISDKIRLNSCLASATLFFGDNDFFIYAIFKLGNV